MEVVYSYRCHPLFRVYILLFKISFSVSDSLGYLISLFSQISGTLMYTSLTPIHLVYSLFLLHLISSSATPALSCPYPPHDRTKEVVIRVMFRVPSYPIHTYRFKGMGSVPLSISSGLIPVGCESSSSPPYHPVPVLNPLMIIFN